ncbi:MAG: hypothetical protein E7335_05795 [Clostridiales bacterium]|nr:hypothetical protein [Clostridiales bacterium]
MYIADLHIHSRFSRATSRDLDAAQLDLWARRKGISLVGTGDFTHPAWCEELKEMLEETDGGVYRLRREHVLECEAQADEPRFVISGEISSIYKKNGKTRKVHSLILLPTLEAAHALSQRLEKIGNIHSDGRPILGLDCRDLLEITLDTCPQAIYIPAHIWTPHFSVFGAFSGFDSLEECFGDMTKYVRAVETGLSSDPTMNWRVSALDGLTLVSNSDAHSPAKLGREANLIEGEIAYDTLRNAILTGEGFGGTIEFFPEEGKYHLDGHRKCGVCMEPTESAAHDNKCPVCSKAMTIGVLHRVEELADREAGIRPEGAKPFESLIPLQEVIGAAISASPEGKRVQEMCFNLRKVLGGEMQILRTCALADIEAAAGFAVAEGIRRMRKGEVMLQGGFDGEYGKISLFAPGELAIMEGQMAFEGLLPEKSDTKKKTSKSGVKAQKKTDEEEPKENITPGLNNEQRMAVESEEAHLAIVAGPGTGKTKTLVERIVHLIENGAKPSEITAVTFTNQAAKEMRTRLEERLGGKKAIRGMTIGTFHAICHSLLNKKLLLGETQMHEVVREILSAAESKMSPAAFCGKISAVKNGQTLEMVGLKPELFDAYCAKLAEMNARDLDDLLLDALEMDFSGKRMFTHLLVDEYQDINAVQRKLVLHFGKNGKTLFVIGDADQSIYGFRGADAGCFDALRRELPDMKCIRLKENYRCTPQIVRAAVQVIANNPGEERVLHANRADGKNVRIAAGGSAFSEAVFIAKEIVRMTGGMDMLEARAAEETRAFSEIAVLARTRRQLDLIESCLRHEDIPCVICGRENYLESDTVRGAVAFFRSLLDLEDNVSLRTALRLVFGCTEAEAEAACAACRNKDLDEVLSDMSEGMGNASLWARTALEFLPRVQKEKPAKLLEKWSKLFGDDPEIKKLQSAAAFEGSMEAFLQSLVLGEEADIRRASGKEYASGSVHLMTLHASKGLEFPVVFLAGVDAGTLPMERMGEILQIEEERRLFFVGITRARDELILTHTGTPSGFLQELPRDVEWGNIPARKREEKVEQISFF